MISKPSRQNYSLCKYFFSFKRFLAAVDPNLKHTFKTAVSDIVILNINLLLPILYAVIESIVH